MNNSVTNILILLAGGSGTRYQSDKPKQYDEINGKELIAYSLEEMTGSKEADRIIVVLNNDPERMEQIRSSYDVDVIPGGKERAYSFQNALDHIKANYPSCRKVIFHEVARPLVGVDIIDRYFGLLDEYDYVESCTKIHDSLGSYVQRSPRREDYFLIQAPEAYRFSVLMQYYDCDSEIYFAANQFPEFVKGYQYFDIPHNIKLTTQDDKVLIEYLLKKQKG